MNITQTFNQHVVKQKNKSLILHSIKELSPISRADLANKTGLNKGTVSSLVTELLDEHLILESGPGISSGGRRPVMLLFNQSAGYSIGIDIGVNYILFILTDLQGVICNEKQVKVRNLTVTEATEILFGVIDEFIMNMPESPYGLIGIGIGVPGTVSSTGNILLAPNLNWENIDLKNIVEVMYKVPVRVKNEANAGAYGEKRFGAGLEANNIVYISGGIGIGVGLILDGKLYQGHNGLSGELGHMTINMEGPVCNCGNKGCWELYASEQALLKMAVTQGIFNEKIDDVSLEQLVMLAESGHKQTINLIQELSDHLVVGMNNIINTFNPEQIIIGNRLVALRSWLEDSLNEKLKRQVFKAHQDNLKIQFSQLNKRSAALGVSAFAVEDFLAMNLEEN
ncbi:ROK family transcriptional regulator [Bacillus suaedae]|uniref:ROK family protein n=1 Tax=Halalkalibacter suaedae TaxID=2822140 RepID=A0A941ARP9_9BACI|nr:ROK family protein [Bacillus suaedae]